MNSPLKLALSAFAALALFAAAFVGFALARGARPDEIPVVGALFAPRAPSIPPPLAAPQPRAPAAAHAEPARESAARASVLDLFQLPSPFEADELAALVEELERKGRDLDARTHDVAAREDRAKDRERWLDQRAAELTRLRTELEVWKDDLEARERGLAPPASTSGETGGGWQSLAKLFAEGDAAELAPRLATYSPVEAAQLLRAMRTARAKELLEALPAEKWREYADAYRLAEPPAGE
jgi:hypothetical protein